MAPAEQGASLAVTVEGEIDAARDPGLVAYHFPVVIEVVSVEPPPASGQLGEAVVNSITAGLTA